MFCEVNRLSHVRSIDVSFWPFDVNKFFFYPGYKLVWILWCHQLYACFSWKGKVAPPQPTFKFTPVLCNWLLHGINTFCGYTAKLLFHEWPMRHSDYTETGQWRCSHWLITTSRTVTTRLSNCVSLCAAGSLQWLCKPSLSGHDVVTVPHRWLME